MCFKEAWSKFTGLSHFTVFTLKDNGCSTNTVKYPGCAAQRQENMNRSPCTGFYRPLNQSECSILQSHIIIIVSMVDNIVEYYIARQYTGMITFHWMHRTGTPQFHPNPFWHILHCYLTKSCFNTADAYLVLITSNINIK